MDPEVIGRGKPIIIRNDWYDCSQTELWRGKRGQILSQCVLRVQCETIRVTNIPFKATSSGSHI